MKITALESHVRPARIRNWILAKIVIDQPRLQSPGAVTKKPHPPAPL